MKRIFLFIVTNLAVMLVLGLVASLLGVNRFLTSNGLNLGALLGFAAVMGFGGAFISLLMSKWMAKMSTGAQVITQPQSADEAWLLDTVRRQAERAGIGMPEVAVYEAEDINAFATGEEQIVMLGGIFGAARNVTEIAMVLATQPDVLLLDEPLAGMGAEEAALMVELLRKLAPQIRIRILASNSLSD